MPKLKPTDEVLIYPNGGWHYHIKGCWMARTDMPHKEANYIVVQFKDVNTKYKPQSSFSKYYPDACVKRYENDLPINPELRL